MKKSLTIIIPAALVTFGLAFSFAPTAAATPQTGDSIQAIRQQYATINRNLRKYRKVKKELSGFSTEGGELLAYFNGSAIMKTAATFYGESGKAFEEYYYRDDRLIFVFRKEFRYTKPLSGKVAGVKENRFYFSNDSIIRWIDENAKQVAGGSNEYQEKQKEYLESSKQFTEGARSAQSVIEGNP